MTCVCTYARLESLEAQADPVARERMTRKARLELVAEASGDGSIFELPELH